MHRIREKRASGSSHFVGRTPDLAVVDRRLRHRRDPRQQRRHRGSAVAAEGSQRGAVGPRARCEPQGRIPLRQGGAAGDDDPTLRQDRQHRLARGPSDVLLRPRGLRRVEARPHRAHAAPRVGGGRLRHQRQCDLPGRGDDAADGARHHAPASRRADQAARPARQLLHDRGHRRGSVVSRGARSLRMRRRFRALHAGRRRRPALTAVPAVAPGRRRAAARPHSAWRRDSSGATSRCRR